MNKKINTKKKINKTHKIIINLEVKLLIMI